MKFLYNFIYWISQSLRSSNYKLYRKLVELPILQKIVKTISKDKYVEILTPEGYKMSITPIYHGPYLTEQRIAEYEPDMRKLLKSVLQQGMVVYDVGANVGLLSLCSLKCIGKKGCVYAFEPEENNFQCLTKTKESNSLMNLKIQMTCVGENTGSQLFDRRGGAFSGRLIDNDSSEKENVVSVSVVSLDDFVFKNEEQPPSLIKIDVEGNEIKVINGMRRVLSEYTPIIICELHQTLDSSVVDIFSILKEYKYFFYNISDWINDKKDPLSDFGNARHVIAICQNNS